MRLAAPLLLAAATLGFASPAASAEVSVAKAKSLCREAVVSATAPEAPRVSFDSGHKAMRAVSGAFIFDIRVRTRDGRPEKAVCTVDRLAASARVTKPAA